MVLSELIFLFLKGILIGFAIAAPVGPIAVLCIRRTLSGRSILGFLTGLGAGMADTFYGAVAAFGFASISDFMDEYNLYIRLGGGILLGWIGVRNFMTPPQRNNQENGDHETLVHGFTSAFFLTLSNPLTLIVFAAAFAAMGIEPLDDSLFQALSLVIGVFVGACSWWLSLTTFVYLMHHKLSDTQLLWINRVSGVLLIGFAAYMLGSLLPL